MLILCKFSLVGLNLLLLTHIAHAFVLLTANMEDVKKLARKFVSEQIAEKIVSFIATAAESVINAQVNTKTNNPGTQETTHQFSEENNKYSEQDVLKSKEEVATNAKETDSGSSEIEQAKKTTKRRKHNLKMVNTFEGKSRYIDGNEIEMETKHDAIRHKTKKDIRNGYREEIVTTEAVDSKHGAHRLSAYNSLDLDDTKVADVVHFEVDNTTTTPDEFPENDKYQDRAIEIELTTRKLEAEDFDQYGGKGVSLLATSGPMSLLMPRRMLNDLRWWEKELPKPDVQQVQKR